MKCTFTFNDRVYVAPSRRIAKRFLKFWGYWERFQFLCRRKKAKLYRLRSGWKLKSVELAPQWAASLFVVNDANEVEYMRTSTNDGQDLDLKDS
jgi:hypothetical protein